MVADEQASAYRLFVEPGDAAHPDAQTVAASSRPSARRAEHRIPRQARERPARATGCRVAETRRRRSVQDGVRPRRTARRSVQAGRAAVSQGPAVLVRRLRHLLAHAHRVFASIALKPLHIPFTVAFRHASAERSETSTLWADVVLNTGAVGCGESCPREYVTGESLDTAQTFFGRHERALREHIVDLSSLRAWMASNAQDIDANPAAWCAIELAILDALAKDAERDGGASALAPRVRGKVSLHGRARRRAARRHSKRRPISTAVLASPTSS